MNPPLIWILFTQFGLRKSNGNWSNDKLVENATAAASHPRVLCKFVKGKEEDLSTFAAAKLSGIRRSTNYEFWTMTQKLVRLIAPIDWFKFKNLICLPANECVYSMTQPTASIPLCGSRVSKTDILYEKCATYHKRSAWPAPTIAWRQYSRRRTYNWPCPAIA